VDTPVFGNLRDGLILNVVGKQNITLFFGQFLPDHPLDPLELHIPGQPGT
jgi:hypothetical protein